MIIIIIICHFHKGHLQIYTWNKPCLYSKYYVPCGNVLHVYISRLLLKCDGTRAETRFSLSAKRTRPFKLAGGVSSVDYWQPRCAHHPTGFVLLVQACVLQSRDAYWLPTPFSFPLHFSSRASPCAITFQRDSALQCTRARASMALFCISFMTCLPDTCKLFKYFLNAFEMIWVAARITGIAFVFTVHMRCIPTVSSL